MTYTLQYILTHFYFMDNILVIANSDNFSLIYLAKHFSTWLFYDPGSSPPALSGIMACRLPPNRSTLTSRGVPAPRHITPICPPGSTAGGGAGYLMTAGRFRSAGAVIRSLPAERQRQLAQRVNHLVSRLSAQDAITAATMLAVGGGLTDLRSLLLSQVVQFLTSEMAMEMCAAPGRDW